MKLSRRGFLLLAAAVYLAGCAEIPTETVRIYRHHYGDATFEALLNVSIARESGLLAFRISAPTSNASMVLDHSWLWNPSKPSTFHVAYVLADGSTWIPGTISNSAEYDLGSFSPENVSAFYLGLGPVEQRKDAPHTLPWEERGIDIHFSDARHATLILMWTGLEGTAHLDALFLPGTQVEKVADVPTAAMVQLADMRGGPMRAGTHLGTIALGDEATLGAAGSDIFSVVRVSRTNGAGELRVETAETSDSIALGDVAESPGARFWLAGKGPVEVSVTVAGVARPRVVVVAAEVPPGILSSLRHEQDLTY